MFDCNVGVVGRIGFANRAARDSPERCKGSGGNCRDSCWWTGVKTSRNSIGNWESTLEPWSDRSASTVRTPSGETGAEFPEAAQGLVNTSFATLPHSEAADPALAKSLHVDETTLATSLELYHLLQNLTTGPALDKMAAAATEKASKRATHWGRDGARR